MSGFYQRHKDELLTGGSLAAPLVVSAVLAALQNGSLVSKLPYVLLAIGYIALVARLLVVTHQRRFLQQRSLSQVRDSSSETTRYRSALDAACSCYYFLGMSAEEFQREIPIHDYFQRRQLEGRPPLEIRVLLLHPDSPHFAGKLHDVNADRDVQELVQRKKEIMRTLVHSFATMPASFGSFEVRFFDARSIWSMQVYDCNALGVGVPDTIRLMPQIAGRHGKHSHVYELDHADPDLFGAFLNFFDGQWEQAQPAQPGGVFPDLYATSGQSVTTLAFDFDGTLVDSSVAKKDAYLNAMRTNTQASEEEVEQAYARHGTLNRVEQLCCAFADVKGRLPTPQEQDQLTASYTKFFRSHMADLQLFPGFFDFYGRFQHRYRFIIVSNAPRDEIIEMCENFGIESNFIRIYGYPTTKVTALREVLDEFSIEPANLLYVGDRAEDGVVAESVGTRFRRLDPSYPPGARPAFVVRSLGELASVLYDLDIGVGS